MVIGSFSRFILVHWTQPTLNYANYLVTGSFSCFILVHWTRPKLKYANYLFPGSFSPLTKIDMCFMYATFIMHSLQHMCILHLCVKCKQNALNCSMCPACMHKESSMHTCSLHMCHIYLPCMCAQFYVPHAC